MAVALTLHCVPCSVRYEVGLTISQGLSVLKPLSPVVLVQEGEQLTRDRHARPWSLQAGEDSHVDSVCFLGGGQRGRHGGWGRLEHCEGPLHWAAYSFQTSPTTSAAGETSAVRP